MNTKEQYIHILRKFVDDHGSEYSIVRMGIFGSVARGEDTKESDIDVLVEFGSPIGIEFIDLSYLIEEALDRKVDIVSRKGIKEKYYKEIEKDIVYV